MERETLPYSTSTTPIPNPKLLITLEAVGLIQRLENNYQGPKTDYLKIKINTTQLITKLCTKT